MSAAFEYRCRLTATGTVPYGGGWARMSLEWAAGQPAALVLQPGSAARLRVEAGFWDKNTGQPTPTPGTQQLRWELLPTCHAGDLPSRLLLKWVAPGVLEIAVPPGAWGDALLRLKSVWQPPAGVPAASSRMASTLPVVLLAPRYVPVYPASGEIDGYPLGAYPPGTEPPRWFVPVPEEVEGYYLTPLFQLGNFTCAQPEHAPVKYTVLDYAILEKLEKLQRRLTQVCPGARLATRRRHHGFRSPKYNAPAGGAPRSRHLWGEAFDFIIVQGDTGKLADLNGDGVVNLDDGFFLRGLVRQMERRGEVRVGGCGVYENVVDGHRTLSFHLDTRGWVADWTKRATD